MRSWLKRIRGAIGVGVTWATGWGTLGGLYWLVRTGAEFGVAGSAPRDEAVRKRMLHNTAKKPSKVRLSVFVNSYFSLDKPVSTKIAQTLSDQPVNLKILSREELYFPSLADRFWHPEVLAY